MSVLKDFSRAADDKEGQSLLVMCFTACERETERESERIRERDREQACLHQDSTNIASSTYVTGKWL